MYNKKLLIYINCIRLIDIMSVSLKQLKAFVAVAEEKSFSLAAERLNATQSGMSMLVQNLELSIGKILINRIPGNMHLTESGKQFYESSLDILKLMEKALLNTKDETRELKGLIECGLMPTFTRSALPNTLSRFLEENPKVEFKITEAYSGVLVEMVRSNKIDFAIVPSVKNSFGLNVNFISQDINILVSSKKSKFDHLKPVTPEILKEKKVKIILPSSENSRRIAINEYFSTHGINPSSILEMDAMIGTLEMVSTTDWCSILPATLCDLDFNDNKRNLSPIDSPKLITDYVLITSASKELSDVTRFFIKKITEEIKKISQNINLQINR